MIKLDSDNSIREFPEETDSIEDKLSRMSMGGFKSPFTPKSLFRGSNVTKEKVTTTKTTLRQCKITSKLSKYTSKNGIKSKESSTTLRKIDIPGLQAKDHKTLNSIIKSPTKPQFRSVKIESKPADDDSIDEIITDKLNYLVRRAAPPPVNKVSSSSLSSIESGNLKDLPESTKVKSTNKYGLKSNNQGDSSYQSKSSTKDLMDYKFLSAYTESPLLCKGRRKGARASLGKLTSSSTKFLKSTNNARDENVVQIHDMRSSRYLKGRTTSADPELVEVTNLNANINDLRKFEAQKVAKMEGVVSFSGSQSDSLNLFGKNRGPKQQPAGVAIDPDTNSRIYYKGQMKIEEELFVSCSEISLEEGELVIEG